MAWGWRKGWKGTWPGNGPFSQLPPWERPGWRYGPGYCWWLAYQQGNLPTTPREEPIPVVNVYTEINNLKKEIKELRKELESYKKG